MLTGTEHEVKWLYNLEDAINNGSGKFKMSGCSMIGSNDCLPAPYLSCEVHFERYGMTGDPLKDTIGRVSWWIFQGVRGMQSKFQMLHGELLEQTLITNLKIGEMITVFGPNEDETGDVMKWLSAAVGLGSTIGGLLPGAVSAFSYSTCSTRQFY